MAAKKRVDLSNIFAKTEPVPSGQSEPEQAGKPKPMSVYLNRAALDRLDQAVQALGVNRHALLQYAVLDWLDKFERGEITVNQETKPTLKAPKSK